MKAYNIGAVDNMFPVITNGQVQLLLAISITVV